MQRNSNVMMDDQMKQVFPTPTICAIRLDKNVSAKRSHSTWLWATVLFVLLAGAQPCNADEPRFGVVRVTNRLDGDLTFFFRWVWRDGRVAADWQRVTIQPGWYQWFAWEYTGTSRTSPDFYCRFDTERDKGRDYWEYCLTRGPSPDEQDTKYGHSYQVVYVNERKEYAELRAITPGATAKLVNKSATLPQVREERPSERDRNLVLLPAPSLSEISCKDFSPLGEDYFTFKCDSNSFAIRYGLAAIKKLIESQPEQRPKYTDYNRLTVKWFRFKGVDTRNRQLLIGFRARYQKLENRPWGGRFTVYDNAADVDVGVNIEIVNSRIQARTIVRHVDTDWPSGPLGWLQSAFDGIGGSMSWISSGRFTTFSDVLADAAPVIANIAYRDKLTFTCTAGMLATQNRNNALYLKRINYDPKGIWFVFGINSSNSQRNTLELIRLAQTISNNGAGCH